MNQQRSDELIHEIGTLIVRNLPTEGMDWSKLALVVTFEYDDPDYWHVSPKTLEVIRLSDDL